MVPFSGMRWPRRRGRLALKFEMLSEDPGLWKETVGQFHLEFWAGQGWDVF